MKATFLYFSFTGNTEYMARQIGSHFEKNGHTVQYFNVMPIVRSMHLISKDPSISKLPPPTGKEEEYVNMVKSVSESEILAVGTITDCGITPPGLAEILEKQWLSDEALSKVKYFVTFSSYGSLPCPLCDMLATILMKRKPTAILSGEINMRAVESWVGLLPSKPYVDSWDEKEVESMHKKAEEIVEFIKKAELSSTLVSSVPYKTVEVDKKVYNTPLEYLGDPVCDRSKCTKCGVCVKNCPYGAITMSKDIEDGFPVFNPLLCYACCLCFNKCPSDAITYKKINGDNLSRYSTPTVLLDKKDCEKKGIIPVPLASAEKVAERGKVIMKEN